MQSIHSSCPVGSVFQYIRVKKTNLLHYLSSVYFVNQPLHVSGVFIAHHQEIHCWLLSWSNQHNTQSTKKNNKYQLLCTSWWWGINTCRGWMTKYTEDKWCIKLVFFTRIFILHFEHLEVYSVFGRDIAAFPVNIIIHSTGTTEKEQYSN
jgi:hypothetical protein